MVRLSTLLVCFGVLSALTSLAMIAFTACAADDDAAAGAEAERRQLLELRTTVRRLREQLAEMALAQPRLARPEGDPLGRLHGQLQSVTPTPSPAPTPPPTPPPPQPLPTTFAAGAGSSSVENAELRRAAGQHPRFRLAFVVPWLGQSFPNWFGHFAASCAASDYIADWLVFHENAQVPPAPRNVIFINLGQHGLGAHFGVQLARLTNQTQHTHSIVRLIQMTFSAFPYAVTEYKPTYGSVFAEYMTEYTHWSYTDIDLVMGNLPVFLDLKELQEFDVVTYSFGDYERLYLRGQFAMHKMERRLARLWTECDFLSANLVRELQLKAALVQEAQKSGKPMRPRFNSAEGCYSRVVTSKNFLRVKYAHKMLADFTAAPEVHLLRGGVRMCANQLPGAAGAASASLKCEPGAASPHRHEEALRGNQREVGKREPVRTHSECSQWVDAEYRVCANVSDITDGEQWNFFLIDGAWYRQRFVDEHAEGLREGALFHFQVWKRAYKKLGQLKVSLADVTSGDGFVLTADGITPASALTAPARQQRS